MGERGGGQAESRNASAMGGFWCQGFGGKREDERERIGEELINN
jgi:hypothetical protein